MSFQQSQERYHKLRQRYQAGDLNAEAFAHKVSQLSQRDAQGRTWSIGVDSGKWYVFQDGSWVESLPPADAADQPSAPEKGGSCLGRGCLISSLLGALLIGCAGTLFLFSGLSGFQLPGMDLGDRIRSQVEEQINTVAPTASSGATAEATVSVPTPGPLAPTRPAPAARSVGLTRYAGQDVSMTFQYPAAWEITSEEIGLVVFQDPQSTAALLAGEVEVEPGTTARDIAQGFREDIEYSEDTLSFKLLESTPWTVPTGDDAHLEVFEFTDAEGIYTVVFDLEIVTGALNDYFYLVVENHDQAAVYAELIELIGASYGQ